MVQSVMNEALSWKFPVHLQFVDGDAIDTRDEFQKFKLVRNGVTTEAQFMAVSASNLVTRVQTAKTRRDSSLQALDKIVAEFNQGETARRDENVPLAYLQNSARYIELRSLVGKAMIEAAKSLIRSDYAVTARNAYVAIRRRCDTGSSTPQFQFKQEGVLEQGLPPDTSRAF
jgi:hypothetical protein